MSTNPSASLKLTQQDHLMSKLSGTGTPDTTQHEWAEAQARDTAALIASSPDLLSYLAAAQGSSVERVGIVPLLLSIRLIQVTELTLLSSGAVRTAGKDAQALR